MMQRADVIVAGAGPAGSMTALLLARAGFHVLILDRADFPRAKPCGDCLSYEASRLMERHNLLDAIRGIPHARLRGWRIYSPGGFHFEASFADPPHGGSSGAIAIERSRFDTMLLRAACDAGARFIPYARVSTVMIEDNAVCGVTFTRGRSSESVRARHVVGADGLRSITARRLGAVARGGHVRKLSLTAHVDGSLDFDDYGEMHVAHGYCIGVAPVDRTHERWNVTVVADSDMHGRAVAAGAREFFIACMEQCPGTRDRIGHRQITPAIDNILASGPFDSPVRRVAYTGASLVGDAAGYFDPFTGQGVYHALRGAELLAHALIIPLRDNDTSPVSAPGYSRAARRLTRGTRRLQRLIDSVLSRPLLADAAIHRLSQAPVAASALLEVTGDMRPVRALFTPAVAGSLLFPRTSA